MHVKQKTATRPGSLSWNVEKLERLERLERLEPVRPVNGLNVWNYLNAGCRRRWNLPKPGKTFRLHGKVDQGAVFDLGGTQLTQVGHV